MVGYIEKLINLKSNMMALATKDAAFTSTLHLQGPPLTPDNIAVKELLENLHPNDTFQPPTIPSTPSFVTCHIANPMVINSDMHHHHGVHQLVELTALHKDIEQTFATFSAFL